jgi:hypothetical protein
MKPKRYDAGGNSATVEKMFPSGMYLVECRIGGELHDKVRCDDYRSAQDYFAAFKAIARGSKS